MASTSILAQGTSFAIAGTPGASITITGVTKAKPAVVTASNTLNVGDFVVFGTVAGMPEISSRYGIVSAATGSSFTVNIDASNFANVGTTGTAIPQTFTALANVHDYSGFDGASSEIDVTNLASGAKEYSPGLEDFGQFALNMHVDTTDAGQLAMRAAKTAQNKTYFKLIMRNSSIRVIYGFVKKFSEAGAVDGVVMASVDVRISGRPSFSESVN